MTPERRLMLVVGAVVFVDTMFYAAIAPLLPELTHSLRMSKLSAGVMTGSYPLGTLLGSLPGGMLATRAGPKRTMGLGLALLGLSTLGFGLLHSAPSLDVARFVEGASGACSWAGGLAWIVAARPSSERGAAIGGVLGAAVAGALFGPVIGTLASELGRPLTFGGVSVVAVALIALARRLPAPHAVSTQGLRHLLSACRRAPMIWSMWLVTLPGAASGAINVLGPLRLARFGAGSATIGGTFLVAAACEAVISPRVGRLADRRGPLVPVRSGIASLAVLLACFAMVTEQVPVMLLIVLAVAALGMCFGPAMSMVSRVGEQIGLDQGLAVALMNLAWAIGQIVGSSGSGAIAKGTGDGPPTRVLAALCVVTVAATLRTRRRASRE